MVPVPFVDLKADYLEVRDEVARRFARVLDSQIFVLGEESGQLEATMRALTGAGAAIACSSGSEALCLALRALGVAAGHAVLVPAFTFVATAGSVARAGALPVFTDVDPRTFTLGTAELTRAIDREFTGTPGARVHRRTGARLRALVAVHLYGRAADMGAIGELAETERIDVIEDAAQAIGARGDCGAVGAWGRVGCFSFYPTKNIGGAGDGGVVTTRDPALDERIRALREHGRRAGTELYEDCGGNARLAELAAAYINAKLARLAAWTEARNELARVYRAGLAGLASRGRLVLPEPLESPAHVWHQFVVRVPGARERVRARLATAGVETRVFYGRPLHLQPCFAGHGHREGDFPQCELAAREVLSLPIYPSLGRERAERVCDALSQACDG